ncbi:MAG: hypothetical protein K2O34_15540 [Acetatifactor sp.]|nr:hypothetical protein [Acetatifactor sp.]
MKSNVSCISYGGNERGIVKEGIVAIQKVLMGDNVDEKRSLLLALDWFMDPYYGQDVHIANIRSDLVKLLQTVVIWSNEEEVAEDALDLLSSYEWPPFEILEKNLDRVSERLKPYVLEVINMDKEE